MSTADIILSIIIIFIFIFPIALIIRILLAGRDAIIETNEEELQKRKRSIQKVIRFIKFNPKYIFGDYILENKNLVLEVKSYNDRTEFLCKNKIFDNHKMQVLIFSQRKHPKIVSQQHHIEDAYKRNEVFDSICEVFNAHTDIERIKQVLDMEEIPFEERYFNI